MIYCPQCGTPNKPNSKFCKNCAALLAPSTDIRCPICGTLNSEDAPRCRNCGTRLTTTAPYSRSVPGTSAPPGQQTPADAPETITPFNPPPPAPDEPPAPAEAPPLARPTLSRANSDFLRRLGKSPAPTAPPPADDTALPPPGVALTGDSYDYSDIAGEVTPEMRAQLQAHAGTVETLEDEVALARRLLGLAADAASPEAPPSIAPPPTDVELAPPVPTLAPPLVVGEPAPEAPPPLASPLVGGELSALESPAALPASDLALEPPSVPSTLELAPTAEPPSSLSSPELAPTAELSTPPPPTSPVPPPPALPDLQLTGDSYDYSDVGGEVTAEMHAELEAHVDTIASVEDEVALARRLLGLAAEHPAPPSGSTPEITATPGIVAPPPESIAPPVHEPTAGLPATPELVAPPPESTAPPALETGTAAQLAALAAASSSAVAQEVPPAESDANLAAPLVPGELPAWLLELAPPDVVTPTAPPSPGAPITASPSDAALVPELDEVERADLPDWLREPLPAAPAVQAETEPPGPAVPEETADISSPAFAIPGQFTREPAGPVRDLFETVESTGPLAGIRGIIPLAVAVAAPHILTPPAAPLTGGGQAFGALFAPPLALGSAARSAGAFERTAAPGALSSRLIYLLILVAALLPLFFSSELAGLGLQVARTPSAAFFDRLQAVPPGAGVLLAFDYSPGQAVELDPAARAIIADLRARDIALIALTTNPNGVALAQSLLQDAPPSAAVNLGFFSGVHAALDELTRGWMPSYRASAAGAPFGASFDSVPSVDTVNAGYLPGAEVGLRDLALGWLRADRVTATGAPWSSFPLSQQVRSMNDLALVVVLAGDDASLRAWMEQVGPHVTTPIVAATTAALDPQARNYVQAGQLRASLRGLTGAAELELLGNTTGPAVKTTDALAFVSLALVLVILAGNLAGLVRARIPRARL